jgi:hypothetical protein
LICIGISICDSGSESILIPDEVLPCANELMDIIETRPHKRILKVIRWILKDNASQLS